MQFSDEEIEELFRIAAKNMLDVVCSETANVPRKRVLWLAIPPGHQLCEYESLEGFSPRRLERMAHKYTFFGWSRMKKRNEFVAQLIANRTDCSERVKFIDIYPLLIDRRDAHEPPDCLHFIMLHERSPYHEIAHVLFKAFREQ